MQMLKALIPRVKILMGKMPMVLTPMAKMHPEQQQGQQ
jgi:hypothetical protein